MLGFRHYRKPAARAAWRSGGEPGVMRVNRKKISLLLAGAAITVLALAIVQGAGATHVRPQGATPLRASIVPAYKACAAPGNRTHGAPLASPSCNPPVQTSNSLTVGSPDANGAAAN